LQGYGITLATINGLSVLASILEAIPSLPLQVFEKSIVHALKAAAHQAPIPAVGIDASTLVFS
jgi:hypothetical protein